MTKRLSTALNAMLAVGLCAVGVAALSNRPDRADGLQPVQCQSITVIDGDTVRCDGMSYRLVGSGAPDVSGFNTPEPSRYSNAQCPEEERLGDLATDRMRELVAAGAELQAFNATDRYGRGLGRLVMTDGTAIGDVMLREGISQQWPRGRGWCE